jgi:hypothetical protein
MDVQNVKESSRTFRTSRTSHGATPRVRSPIPPATRTPRDVATVDARRAGALPLARSMTVTIAIDPNHPSDVWWREARDAKHAPRELRAMLGGKATTIEVPPKRARQVRTWCATLAGWDPDAPPLSFEGLVGRPPSPRRSAGAGRLTVRLAPDELAILAPLARSRGQSLADLLRASALVEARRAIDAGRRDELAASSSRPPPADGSQPPPRPGRAAATPPRRSRTRTR